MSRKPGERNLSGSRFPVLVFRWKDGHTYAGEEIQHLWFSKVLGEDSYRNVVVMWRGPMDVKLEFVRDQTERDGWEKGARIAGPDLFHVVAEFPQIGSDLPLMYAFQSMLSDELARGLLLMGVGAEIDGTDIYVRRKKLNVGVCAAFPSSCTMHFGVNITLEGEPPLPGGVEAYGLADAFGGDDSRAVDFLVGTVNSWIARIDGLYLKAYKTA